MQTLIRHPRISIALELIIFLALAFGLRLLIAEVNWKFAGPVSLLIMVGLLTTYFKTKGMSWQQFGLPRLTHGRDYLLLLPKAVLTFAVFAAMMGALEWAQSTFNLSFMQEVGDGFEARWGDIRGNLPMFLLWVGIAWTAAAFAEEMVFRGYLISRLNQTFGDTKLSLVIAVVIAAIIFGFGHYYYQGLRGFVMITAVALVFGTMFIVFKRSLYPIVIVHGIVDTLGFCAIYFNWQDV